MMLFWLAVVALVVWFVVRQVRQAGGEDPRRIAERRYAAGEITREQFEQIRRDLGGTPAS